VGISNMLRNWLLVCVICALSAIAAAQTKAHTAKSPERTTNSPAVEAIVKKLEQQWLDAVTKRDQAAVDSLLAPDFRAIAIDGKDRDRRQELATVIDTTRPALTRFFGRLDVSTLAPSVTLTRGLIVLNGEKIREAHIAFTHVWVLRPGGWQVVASQEALENY
jgi:hypothetical protein